MIGSDNTIMKTIKNETEQLHSIPLGHTKYDTNFLPFVPALLACCLHTNGRPFVHKLIMLM